jgi:multisubunit Na+/H+ antiporter MnhB subunit
MIHFIVLYFGGCIATILTMIVFNHLWFKRDKSFMGTPQLEEASLLIVCSWIGCALILTVFLFDILYFIKDKVFDYINTFNYNSKYTEIIKKILGVR